MERPKSHLLFLSLSVFAFVVSAERCHATVVDSPDSTAASQQADESKTPVFERRKDQRQYEKILLRLARLETEDGSETSPDDWFVVGGATGDGSVNFDVFQGTEDVARRVVEFTAAYDNQCQWRIFHRTSDQSEAQELLGDVKSRYANWVREQKQLAEAYRQSQRQQAQAGRSRCGPRG